MKTALTIAGSDCSGGAGIQADLKTMTANGVYGMSVITALTAQNTMGVRGVYTMSEECISQQLDAVFTDIFPDSVKIGMLADSTVIRIVSEKLREYKPKNIVLDPVMISTSGHPLLEADAINALVSLLFPIADLMTPNIPEAEVLLDRQICCEDEMLKAAKQLSEKYNMAVLLKGGHLTDSGSDMLYENGSHTWFKDKHIDNPNTHGTGCTLSSAIASNLAKGLPMNEAVSSAKAYISGAISDMMNLGHGHGPVNHMWNLLDNK